MLMERCEVSLAWAQVNSLVTRFSWGGLRVGGNYVRCLAIVIFVGRGGAKKWGGGIFMEGIRPLSHTMERA